MDPATAPDRPARLVVLGSANLDQVLGVDAAPGPGTTVSSRDYREDAGGKGLNQAVAAARAGAAVAFVGAVGDDDAGRALREALHATGVGVDLLRTVAGPSGRAVVVVDADRENRIVLVPGAHAALVGLTDDDRAALEAADGLLLQLEVPLPVVVQAARVAHAAGVRVALTPAPVQPLPDELCAALSLLLVNEHELAELTGLDDLEEGLVALLARVPAVVVTRGARGASYADRAGLRVDRDAERVEVVDTTAAGDTWAGWFVASWCAGVPVPEAVGLAGRAAALTVGRSGTSSSIPTAAEVARLSAGGNTDPGGGGWAPGEHPRDQPHP